MKIFRYIIAVILSVCIGICLANWLIRGENPVDFSYAEDVDDKKPTAGEKTYYGQLTDYQKAIYDELLQTVANCEEKLELTNVNIEDFRNNCYPASLAIQYDHPELFWFTGGYRLQFRQLRFSETGEVTMTPTYYQYASALFDHEGKHTRLMEAVKNVAAQARAHASDRYEQIIFVHDYLIENAYYDHDALNNYYQTAHDPTCEYIFSAYGCLVDGKTVCSGYAKAFQLVLRELGQECAYVTGDAGGPHGWNCVYLDGDGYYVDVTWDDKDLEEEIPMYNYAFLNDQALGKTHRVDMEFDAPVCKETKYNYFVVRNYFVENYDFEKVAKILSSQTEADAVYVRFGSEQAYKEAYEELIKEKKIRKVAGIEPFHYIFRNDNQYTISLTRNK